MLPNPFRCVLPRAPAAREPALPCRARRAAPGAVLAGLVACTLLAGCGGGGDNGDPFDAAADATFVDATLVAPVDDVGGLTVKGVDLDARAARYVDDDGVERPVDEIDVGMTVEVDARLAADGSQGVARGVRSTLALQGPVDGVSGESALIALGTPVRIDASTALVGVETAGALRPGDPVRIHGLQGADGTLVATRIERAAAPFAQTRLRGTVTALDASESSFSLGPLRVSFRGAAIRGSLADGVRVVVTSDRAPVDGRWTATAVAVEPTPRFGEGTAVAVEGLVSGFRSLADFRVGGVPVDGSSAAVVGDPAGLRDGVRVTVRGVWRGNRIDAASIGFFAADRPRTIVGLGPVFGAPLFWGPGSWGPGWFPWVPAASVGLSSGIVRGPFSSSWLSTPVPPRPPTPSVRPPTRPTPPGPIPSGAGGAFSRPAPSFQPDAPSVRPAPPPSVRPAPVPAPSVRPTPGGPRGGWFGSRGRAAR
jgi:hypothetical protein